MNEIPPPTPEEERSLRICISDWDDCTPLQQALALAVWRGYDRYETASDYLDVPVDLLREANRTLWGILYDGGTGKLWIK